MIARSRLHLLFANFASLGADQQWPHLQCHPVELKLLITYATIEVQLHQPVHGVFIAVPSITDLCVQQLHCSRVILAAYQAGKVGHGGDDGLDLDRPRLGALSLVVGQPRAARAGVGSKEDKVKRTLPLQLLTRSQLDSVWIRSDHT